MTKSYCGCCGRESGPGEWCRDCRQHLGSSLLPAFERTYFAQHGQSCPFDIADEEAEEKR